MALYITGDIHGKISRLNPYRLKRDGYHLTQKDTMLIAGDLMVPWLHPNISPEDCVKLRMLDNCGFTIAFIDGNHENFDFLDGLDTMKWNGGKAHRLGKNIFHLMRGEVFTIEGKKILAMGGATSVDKDERMERLTWWKQETVTVNDYKHAMDTLKQYDNKVDIVLSHTIPEYNGEPDEDVSCIYLQLLRNEITFDKWIYGHMHRNEFHSDIGLYCIYDAIMKL